MTRATPILRNGRKALQDLNLLKVLQSEIKHELSAHRFQSNRGGGLGDFVVDWDSPESEDVILRRKCESGEEVAVSALLGPETFAEGISFPREILMKVCINKPGLRSVLQFDCGISEKGVRGSEFDIHNAYYLQSGTCPGSSVYRGPLFCNLDPQLQDALKEYLVSKGINKSFTNFLLYHLHKKEQDQYVKWLHKLESLIAKGK